MSLLPPRSARVLRRARLAAVARQIEGVAALQQLQALDLSHNAISDLEEGTARACTPL